MADFTINLENALRQRATGQLAVGLEPALGDVRQLLTALPNPFIQTEKGFEAGRPMNRGPVPDRRVLVSRLELDGLELTLATVEVSGRKHVVTTKIAGADNTVNEVVGFDTWAVKITGYVISPPSAQPDAVFGRFPAQGLRQQVKLFRKNQSVKVACEYLRLFDIHNLLLTDVSYPDMAGHEDVFAYEFSAVSDTPVELLIK
jgi:hypothetical protein